MQSASKILLVISEMVCTALLILSASCMKAERVGTDSSSPEGFVLGGVNLGLINGGAATDSGPKTIGGMVSGLISGQTLTIQNNGADDLVINGNGAFTFNTASTVYNVTILTQPTALRCLVQSGSGTAALNITSVIITCPVAYTASLNWIRCTYGQAWNSLTGDCTGTGSGPGYGATAVSYCTTSNCTDTTAESDGFLNGGTVTGHLAGSGSSQAYSACASLNAGAGTYGKTNWRVPWRSELKKLVNCSTGPVAPLNDGSGCNSGASVPTVDTATFPNTVSNRYWTSSAGIPGGFGAGAYSVGFFSGDTGSGYGQSYAQYLRCVAD